MTKLNLDTHTPFDASHLAPVMVAGIGNARKAALQIGLSIACTVIAKNDDISNLELAQLCGWKGDVAPSRKKGSASEKTLAERIKNYRPDVSAVVKALPYITDSVKAQFNTLYNCTSVSDFNTEAAQLVRTLYLDEDTLLENKKDLAYFWSGFLPENGGLVQTTTDTTEVVEEAVNTTVDVDLETAPKKPVVNQDEINNRQALAHDALALLADEMPFLNTLLATAQKQDTQEGVILTICQGFKAELDKVDAEKLALENKLKSLTPKAKAKAKAKAKKAA